MTKINWRKKDSTLNEKKERGQKQGDGERGKRREIKEREWE